MQHPSHWPKAHKICRNCRALKKGSLRLSARSKSNLVLTQKDEKCILYQNVLLHEKGCFGTRFRETMITNSVLTQNDAKRTLSQKRPFRRVRETVITNPVLTQNDAKRTVIQKRRFGTRIRETVITNPVLTQNDATRTLHKNILSVLDFNTK